MIYYFRDPDTVVLIPVTDTEDSEPQFIPPPAPPSLIHSRYFINFMFYILSIFCFSDEILAEIEKLSPLTSTRLSSGHEPSKKRARLDWSKTPPRYNPDAIMDCHYWSPPKKTPPKNTPPKNSVSVPISFPPNIDKGDHTVSRDSTMMESTSEQHEDEEMAEQNEDEETTLVRNEDNERDEDNEGNENEDKLVISEQEQPTE